MTSSVFLQIGELHTKFEALLIDALLYADAYGSPPTAELSKSTSGRIHEG